MIIIILTIYKNKKTNNVTNYKNFIDHPVI